MAETSGPTGRRRWLLPAWLGSLLLVAGVLLVVGTKIKSPSQAAATATPPAPTIITASLSEEVLSQSTVLRANVSLSAPVSIAMPTLPSGSDPVTTSISKGLGSTVRSGDVLASISGRPIFVLQGPIAAYRTMAYGDSGADVAELQRALEMSGLGIGSDTPGSYGPGTASAVGALYRDAGYTAITALAGSADGAGTPTSGTDSSGEASSVGSTTASQGSDAQSSTTTAPVSYATVPLGEIVFLPTLPATVETTSLQLGRPVTGLSGAYASGSGTSASEATQGTSGSEIYTLGSGGVTLSGQVDVPDSKLLRTGMTATVNDDVNGGQWPAVVTSVVQPDPADATESGLSEATVSLAGSADDPIPESELGQNVRVTIQESATAGPVLAAPVSAIYARADGLSYVTVVKGDKQVPVVVKVGLEAGGLVEITPVGASLTPGDDVVVGAGSAITPQG